VSLPSSLLKFDLTELVSLYVYLVLCHRRTCRTHITAKSLRATCVQDRLLPRVLPLQFHLTLMLIYLISPILRLHQSAEELLRHPTLLLLLVVNGRLPHPMFTLTRTQNLLHTHITSLCQMSRVFGVPVILWSQSLIPLPPVPCRK